MQSLRNSVLLLFSFIELKNVIAVVSLDKAVHICLFAYMQDQSNKSLIFSKYLSNLSSNTRTYIDEENFKTSAQILHIHGR